MKKKVSLDLVLVSDAKSPDLKNLTDIAIASAGTSINIIVIESNHEVTYPNVKTIHPTIPFNYNAYLNIGANAGYSDYIFFGNNDLIFMENWEVNLIEEMISNKVDSASPISPVFYLPDSPRINTGSLFGYELMTRFCGWAFIWTRELYNKIGKLDEDFIFWCSDNATIEQLKSFNAQHILVTSSLVQHLGNSTLTTLNNHLMYEYTISEVDKFNKKFKRDLWDEPHLKHLKPQN
jgi:hypothetical protein